LLQHGGEGWSEEHGEQPITDPLLDPLHRQPEQLGVGAQDVARPRTAREEGVLVGGHDELGAVGGLGVVACVHLYSCNGAR